MDSLEELIYCIGFMLGDIVGLFGFIGSAVALDYDSNNPDTSGAIISFSVGLVFLAVCFYSWNKLFPNESP